MRKLRLLFTCLLTFLALGSALAQTITVKGEVKDANTGEGVPFASVVIKGTMTGVSTDVNGAFTINAPANGTLDFSAVGYIAQSVQIGGRTEVIVTLDPDSEMLDETIVIAYGTATKSSFTGSATVVGSETIS